MEEITLEIFSQQLQELLPHWRLARPGRLTFKPPSDWQERGHKKMYNLICKEIESGIFEIRADADVTQDLPDMYYDRFRKGKILGHSIDTREFIGYLTFSTKN